MDAAKRQASRPHLAGGLNDFHDVVWRSGIISDVLEELCHPWSVGKREEYKRRSLNRVSGFSETRATDGTVKQDCAVRDARLRSVKHARSRLESYGSGDRHSIAKREAGRFCVDREFYLDAACCHPHQPTSRPS